MGLLSYILPKKGKDAPAAPAVTHTAPSIIGSGLQTPHGELTEEQEKRRTMRFDVMSDYLRAQQLQRRWTTESAADEGIVLKVGRQEYVCTPPELAARQGGFMHAIEALNVRSAITVDTPVIRRFAGMANICLPGGLRLQVLPDITYLPSCQKHQCVAYIADRASLIVWDDNPTNILDRAAKIEADLLSIIWSEDSNIWSDKKAADIYTSEVSSIAESSPSEDIDVETAGEPTVNPSDKAVLTQPLIIAVTVAVMLYFSLQSWSSIIQAVQMDGEYIDCAYILFLPFVIWTSLFFWQALVFQIFQLFGPVTQVHQSSKFYSGTAPKRIQRGAGKLPHFTIQCPVYKEGLEAVIVPTIRSLNQAIATYEMQGGTANIFINDDGLQLLPEDERRARIECYEEYGIGWVARPGHKPNPAEGEEPFIRRGKFKKASNMNYAMWVSTRVEEKLLALDRHPAWSVAEEAAAYAEALVQVVEEDQGRTWCDGDIRFGDFILIIDSDTEVPRDCLLDAASEMEQNPRTAILQYASGVMNVTDSFFEKAITWFTNLIYTQIRYAVACGDTAPFVGHNAILRWDAIQAIEYICKHDNRAKWWSEDTVSEDFDMSLRLQGEGYLVRLAGYKNGGETYNEGVSLTIYDELARWEKYAYGCSELLFHPLRYWPTRGPFTKLFRDFVRSPIPLTSKITIMSYIGTYYAIGSSWVLTVANYFVVGWYNGYYAGFYRPGFGVYIGLLFVFTALGNVALAVLRWRTGEKGLIAALAENFKWVLLMAIFFGGISLHVSQALLSHLFSVDMQWGATSKEASSLTFFEEIPRVLKGFKYTFAFCGLFMIGMILLASEAVPEMWRIDTFVAIFPLALTVGCHALLPIALNPNLIVFKW